MAPAPIERLRTSCVRVRAPARTGTGYFVESDLIATCEHVIESAGDGGEVEIEFQSDRLTGRILRSDRSTDCALIQLARPSELATVLGLAAQYDGTGSWNGYGFPALASGTAIPLSGIVMDPCSLDDQKRMVRTLYSDSVAAGMAAPIHGFSGSPVLVNDVVVGHLSRVLSMPGAEGRPALGLIYAARSENMLALLGTRSATPAPPAHRVPRLADLVPPLPEGQYHVFVSYRSTDRNWAVRLVDRLIGFGMKVILDQREIADSRVRESGMAEMLERSQAAVILISREWVQSPWSEDEANVMLALAHRRSSFRIIPLRLDDIQVPQFLAATYTPIDFANSSEPGGAGLETLAYAILRVPRPPPESDAGQLSTGITNATDEALRQIERIVRDPSKVKHAIALLDDAGLPKSASVLRAAAALIGAGNLEVALELLDAAPHSVRSQQLRALALSKLGPSRHEETIAILEELGREGHFDPETCGILGGHYKRLWRSTHADQYLLTSERIYREAYERTGSIYNGINAAALALMRDAPRDAAQIAAAIRDALDRRIRRELDHYELATAGEARLILGDLDEARRWYADAGAHAIARNLFQDVAVMRRQAKMLLEKQQLAPDALDRDLPVPRVVAFTGHMADAPGRHIPRLPEAKLDAVRREIRASLRKFRTLPLGIASAARGSDIIFLEEVLALMGSVRVFLPFPSALFRRTSVGEPWLERYERIINSDRVSVRVLDESITAEPADGIAYQSCNLVIMEEARRLAELFDQDPVLIAVYNGAVGDGPGGAGDTVAMWEGEGLKVERIDPSKL